MGRFLAAIERSFREGRSDGAGDHDRGAGRDASGRWRWLVISHLLLGFSALLLWVYFFLLNRTSVTGRPREIGPNTLFVSNHQSSLDGYLIAVAALFPRCLVRPWSMPWSLAIAEHFYRSPLRSWLSNHLRCIPVRRGAGDSLALRRLMAVLPGSVAIFFPEGRRSEDGSIGVARPGVGLLVLHARPRVIPVAIEGMREAVRFDRFGLRFFRRIAISFGEPIELGDHRQGVPPDSRDAARGGVHSGAREVTEAIMERVRIRHDTLRRVAGRG